jgi:hypothetical protein
MTDVALGEPLLHRPREERAEVRAAAAGRHCAVADFDARELLLHLDPLDVRDALPVERLEVVAQQIEPREAQRRRTEAALFQVVLFRRQIKFHGRRQRAVAGGGGALLLPLLLRVAAELRPRQHLLRLGARRRRADRRAVSDLETAHLAGGVPILRDPRLPHVAAVAADAEAEAAQRVVEKYLVDFSTLQPQLADGLVVELHRLTPSVGIAR